MGDFRSFKTAARRPVEAMQPVVDPADWSPESLKDVANWSYRISDRDARELAAGVAAVRRAGVPIVDLKRESFPLTAFGDVLSDVRRELLNGRGIVMMQNFPLDRFNREETAIGSLSRRELTITRLVHRGMSNRQIAEDFDALQQIEPFTDVAPTGPDREGAEEIAANRALRLICT